MQTPEVRMLMQVDKRFTRGRWTRGRRVRNSLDFCLVAAIDEAAAVHPPAVSARVMQELVRGLPAPLRAVGARAPRATLAFYNDFVGRRRGTLRLVKTTLARLSTTSAFTAQAIGTTSVVRPPQPLTGPSGIDSSPIVIPDIVPTRNDA